MNSRGVFGPLKEVFKDGCWVDFMYALSPIFNSPGCPLLQRPEPTTSVLYLRPNAESCLYPKKKFVI